MSRVRAAVAGVVIALILGGGVFVAHTTGASSAPQTKLKVGDTAPDFTMKDQNGKDVSLHDFRGKKNVALAFYVFAFTGG